MNLTTSLKLVELMQPNQPLLQRLLREAPGTYQHSLQVANLAELATERIGGNATLVRVAAMYHDVGKMLNPHFFVENQADGFNPHDMLDDPLQSARLIIAHVTEGDRMARRYRLPQRIREFIREHHGTTKPIFFYHKAIERAGGDTAQVDVGDFTYPGPRPQSKETAILMLADGTESAARAIRPRTEAEVGEVIHMIFERALQEEQLDECSLTLKDLKTIQQSFIETLQGVYHPRIAYPIAQPKKAALSATAQAVPVKAQLAEKSGQPEDSSTEPAPDKIPDLVSDKPPQQKGLPGENGISTAENGHVDVMAATYGAAVADVVVAETGKAAKRKSTAGSANQTVTVSTAGDEPAKQSESKSDGDAL
jgi:putative nucleotidyltransferase with HDIG domain